jgi:hypothetical protein
MEPGKLIDEPDDEAKEGKNNENVDTKDTEATEVSTEMDSSIDPDVGPFVCKHCREEFKTWALLTREDTWSFHLSFVASDWQDS